MCREIKLYNPRENTGIVLYLPWIGFELMNFSTFRDVHNYVTGITPIYLWSVFLSRKHQTTGSDSVC